MRYQDKQSVTKVLQPHRGNYRKSNEDAKWKGIYLSNAIKKYHKTGFIDKDDLLLRSYLQCLRDNKIKIKKCEESIQNWQLKGRVDLIGEIQGEDYLIEVKCCSPHSNKEKTIVWARVQLSLYENIIGKKYKKKIIIIDNTGKGYRLVNILDWEEILESNEQNQEIIEQKLDKEESKWEKKTIDDYYQKPIKDVKKTSFLKKMWKLFKNYIGNGE